MGNKIKLVVVDETVLDSTEVSVKAGNTVIWRDPTGPLCIDTSQPEVLVELAKHISGQVKALLRCEDDFRVVHTVYRVVLDRTVVCARPLLEKYFEVEYV